MSLTRYVHTLRHLRPIQIYGRLWVRFYRPRPNLAPAPPRRRAGAWHAWAWRPALMPDAASMRFLNVTRRLEAPGDWDAPDVPRLWRYNLHYFDDLAAQEAPRRMAWHRALVARWIVENPPGTGTGWEPYPTSLRIVNWIKWTLATEARGEVALDARGLDSLAAQVRWLRGRLEIHILANHLWANAKALAFAGLFFDGPEADGWLRKAESIFLREIPEQVLADGGHFERSTMYQATLTEDALDLINVHAAFSTHAGSALADGCRAIVPRMLRWLRVMTHPDGRRAFFNDAAFGIAAEYGDLATYASRLGLTVDTAPLAPIEVLEASGYARLENARAVAICDVAAIGPDYLPGHAHADTLSFELSIDGVRTLVNTGTSTYEKGPDREHQRGTAAHNTVVVDGQDSSEVWDSFRVARRARPFDVKWGQDARACWLVAAHDGYLRLPGRVIHAREWRLEAAGLQIRDRLEGAFASAVAVFHLHPAVTAAPAGAGITRLSSPGHDGLAHFRTSPTTPIASTPAAWYPEFGRTEPATVLTIPIGPVGALATDVTW